MEASGIEEDDRMMMITDTLLEEEDDKGPRKGGLRTMPFILAIQSFEQTASYGAAINVIVYLTREYHLKMITASNIIAFWSAATYFMPLLGAIVADSLLGRYRTIFVGCIFSVLGTAALWLTSMIPGSRPPPCNESSSSSSSNICSSATALQMFFLCSSFGLISLGTGGIRSSSIAFGADQLKRGSGQNNSRVQERYFSWYYAASMLSMLIAYTCIVYVEDNIGWQVGFGIVFLLMVFASLSFIMASPLYVKLKSKSSLIIEMIQVAVAAYRNRHKELSAENSNVLFHNKNGSSSLPSDKLRFLNRACFIIDPSKELAEDGTAADPWTLCTVDQVEELKALLKVLPIWSSTMIMAINLSQGSFGVLQAKTMNRKISSSFQVPAASFSIFTMVSAILWITFYDRILLPTASRIMGRPVRLSTKKRMGTGLLVSTLAVTVSAAVETKRRNLAIKEGYSESPEAVLDISALWVVPQNCLHGIAEAMSAVGQNEFYYSEFPRSMSAIAVSLFSLGLSLGNLLASLIMNAIDEITRRGGNESWISTNINKAHYDYVFWFLAGLSALNMMYFFICSWAYGPTKEDSKENPNST